MAIKLRPEVIILSLNKKPLSKDLSDIQYLRSRNY